MEPPAVRVSSLDATVVEIALEDRVNKNTFSAGICQGLFEAFDRVRTESERKVVILTGYDTYFCSGGTQEALQGLSEHQARFTDFPIYSLPLLCPLPVIAAMQGHGIGGGLVFGLFADFVILSRESVYTANFMKYGFTPGFGATLVLAEKLGLPLAQEMLMTAETYRGADLEKRGVPFPVVPRAEVRPRALSLARTLADKPRESLVALKEHMVQKLRRDLPGVTELEVAMHERTFHQPEVKERIRTRFGG